MQRRGEDGAWVAESNHYAFDVVPPLSADRDPGDDSATPDDPAPDPDDDAAAAADEATDPGSDTAADPADGADPGMGGTDRPALADTGTRARPPRAVLARTGGLSAALVAVGCVLFAAARRRVPSRRGRAAVAERADDPHR